MIKLSFVTKFYILYVKILQIGGEKMKAYAVIGWLDDQTDRLYKHIWSTLSKRKVTDYGLGRRPHLTLADYEEVSKERLIQLMEKCYEKHVSIELKLSLLGMFRQTGTLFFAPILTDELDAFHRQHHEFFQELKSQKVSYYQPGHWVPHCTIASRLSKDEMREAFDYCQNLEMNLEASIEEIALIELDLDSQGKVIKEKIICSYKLPSQEIKEER